MHTAATSACLMSIVETLYGAFQLVGIIDGAFINEDVDRSVLIFGGCFF